MVEIVPFPVEATAASESFDCDPGDRFLLDEGLELLADFRSIEDRAVRASLRALVRTTAMALRQPSEPDPV